VLKEWLTMFRDLRRLSGAVWPIGMVAIYAVALGSEERAAPIGSPGLTFWLSAGSLALIPWGASLGISIYAFGTERRNIHLLRSLPFRAPTLLLAKILASLLPVAAVAEAAVVVVCVAQGASVGQSLGIAAIVAWAAVGYVTIDTASAAVSPNFEAEQVQRATTFLGRLFGFAAGSLFTVTSALAIGRLVLFATGTPTALGDLLDWAPAGIEPLGWPLVVLCGSAAALTVVMVATIAQGRLKQLIETGE